MSADSVALVQAQLDQVAAPYVKALQLRVTGHEGDRVTISLPVTPALVHGGGVVCGQSLLAAADTAMVLALSAVLGGFKPMTTVQLNCSFLRPVPADTPELTLSCTVLRRGKTLAFGSIDITLPDGKLAAQATTTYAFL
ncbi:MAG: PaaI family thioesterase [Rubrivivax sp.]|nr:PaaI family thioesterase [Rubrivivax sp.]